MSVCQAEVNCCLVYDCAFTVWFLLSAFHLAHQSFLHTILNSYVFFKRVGAHHYPSLTLPPSTPLLLLLLLRGKHTHKAPQPIICDRRYSQTA